MIVLALLDSEIESEEYFVNENTRSLAFQYIFQHKINYFFSKGEFTKGLEILPELTAKLEENKGVIDEHHVMVFYYRIASLYFGASDFENCIVYLDKIISNKELK